MIVEFNPLVLRTLPLYSLTETQGERRVNSITSIAGIFNPSPRRYAPQLSPIFFCATHRNASGHGKGRRLNANDFLSQSKKVLVTLIRFICSFFSTARRTNQEAPPQLSGACLYSNPPLLLSLRVFLTPPSFGHLPYILRCKTQRRRVRVTLRSLQIQ